MQKLLTFLNKTATVLLLVLFWMAETLVLLIMFGLQVANIGFTAVEAYLADTLNRIIDEVLETE